jgi:hypothetical protein
MSDTSPCTFTEADEDDSDRYPRGNPMTGNTPEQDREQRYAEAIAGGKERAAILATRNPGELANAYRDARAVMAVADAEIEAEMEHHRNCPVCGSGEEGCCVCEQMKRAEAAEAEVERLRGINHELVETHNTYLGIVAKVERDRDEKAAALARVEALADLWDEGQLPWERNANVYLRAALDGPSGREDEAHDA